MSQIFAFGLAQDKSRGMAVHRSVLVHSLRYTEKPNSKVRSCASVLTGCQVTKLGLPSRAETRDFGTKSQQHASPVVSTTIFDAVGF